MSGESKKTTARTVAQALAELGNPVVTELNGLARDKRPRVVLGLRDCKCLLARLPGELIREDARLEEKARALEL